MTTHNASAKKANRKSAVERLEESKGNYVKTVSVLDCKQKFEHSSTLHVSTSPKIDVLLGVPIKNSYHSQSSSQSEGHRNDLPVIKRTKLRSSTFDSKLKAFRKSETINKTSSLTDFDCCIFNSHDNEKPAKPATPLLKVDYSSIRSRYRYLKGIDSPQHSHRQNRFEFSQHDSNCAEERYRTSLDAECFSTHEESEEEEPSTDDTRDSLSVGDVMELEDKGICSKTSDYVSRSSSFKCSDRVRNLVDRFETQLSQSKQETKGKISTKRKSVSRSKSDVSHSFSRGLGLHPERIHNDSDLERFFNTMGLDTMSWNNLTSLPSSPAHFFDSISSVNSDDHLSSICSEGSIGETPREGLTNRDLLRHAPTETSIVEKNARVVKWLYNCHNARREFSIKKF